MSKSSTAIAETTVPESSGSAALHADGTLMVNNEGLVQEYLQDLLEDPIIKDQWVSTGTEYVTNYVTDLVEESCNFNRGGMVIPDKNANGANLFKKRGLFVYDEEASKKTAYDKGTRLVAVCREVQVVADRLVQHVKIVDDKEANQVVTTTTNYNLLNRYDQFNDAEVSKPKDEPAPQKKEIGGGHYFLRDSDLKVVGDHITAYNEDNKTKQDYFILKEQPRALAEATINSASHKVDQNDQYCQGYVDSGYLITDLALKRVSRRSCNEILPDFKPAY